jgi:3-hydroxyacyl-[acyl-carrier-protein] dehydratase
MENKIVNLSVIEIQEYINIKYPLIMIDRITEIIPGKSAEGYKNLTMNEWFFPPHFPDNPIMPGLLQIEALTQMIMMTFLTLPEYRSKNPLLLGVDGVKFFKQVVPGDRLDIKAGLKSFRRGIAMGWGIGLVNGEMVCKCEYTGAIPDILGSFSPRK